MDTHKTIALVAHDNRKQDLLDWLEWNHEILSHHELICTGTTGKLVEQALDKKEVSGKKNKRSVKKLLSGPLGGDLQLGSLIAEGKIDVLIFFWDPMQPQPHDVDVKALLRISVVHNIPMACNRSTADFMISSPLLGQRYQRQVKDYSTYIHRDI